MIGRQVQRLRKQRGLTLQQLGEAAGLSAAFLSQVEREVSSLSVSSLASIAKALDVSPSFFFDKPEPNGVAVRGYARAPFRMEHAEVVYARLGSSFAGRTMEPLFVTYPPGYVSEDSAHAGEEFYYVLNGQLVVLLDGEEHKLNADDSIHFRSDRRHRLSNVADAPVHVIAVTTPILLE